MPGRDGEVGRHKLGSRRRAPLGPSCRNILEGGSQDHEIRVVNKGS